MHILTTIVFISYYFSQVPAIMSAVKLCIYTVLFRKYTRSCISRIFTAGVPGCSCNKKLCLEMNFAPREWGSMKTKLVLEAELDHGASLTQEVKLIVVQSTRNSPQICHVHAQTKRFGVHEYVHPFQDFLIWFINTDVLKMCDDPWKGVTRYKRIYIYLTGIWRSE